MSIWSKVLVGLILVALLPFFYLSASLLKVSQAWRTEVTKYEKAVWETVNGNAAAGKLSLNELTAKVRDQTVALQNYMVDRGRVWRSVTPERAFNSNTGAGVVIIPAPAPHRIAPKMVLYGFDPTGYLGEFQVMAVDDTKVSLAPNMRFSERLLKRVGNSPGDWTLYEFMPIDRHDILAGLDKAALDALQMPADSVNEYLKDGQPAGPNDPAERVIDGKYERQLNDYARLFHELDRQIAVNIDLKAAAESDVASMAAAVADAKQQIAFHDAEIADLKKELERSQAERDLIIAEYKALVVSLSQLRAEMKSSFQENRKLATEWTAMQTAAARQIDERTPLPQ